jgi:hypothetical protein
LGSCTRSGVVRLDRSRVAQRGPICQVRQHVANFVIVQRRRKVSVSGMVQKVVPGQCLSVTKARRRGAAQVNGCCISVSQAKPTRRGRCVVIADPGLGGVSWAPNIRASDRHPVDRPISFIRSGFVGSHVSLKNGIPPVALAHELVTSHSDGGSSDSARKPPIGTSFAER